MSYICTYTEIYIDMDIQHLDLKYTKSKKKIKFTSLLLLKNHAGHNCTTTLGNMLDAKWQPPSCATTMKMDLFV